MPSQRFQQLHVKRDGGTYEGPDRDENRNTSVVLIGSCDDMGDSLAGRHPPRIPTTMQCCPPIEG